MHFEINRNIQNDLKKIEAIIRHAKGDSVLLAMYVCTNVCKYVCAYVCVCLHL